MDSLSTYTDPVLSGIGENDREVILRIANEALRGLLLKEEFPPPKHEGILNVKAGVFVTLKSRGQLRGCVGYPEPVFPLWEGVRKSAISSAVMDPRFNNVQKEEITRLTIEVTILSPKWEYVHERDHLEIGKHGLIVENDLTSGLLLPQVAIEEVFTVEEFLDATCLKAGLEEGCWRDDNVRTFYFEGLFFQG